MECSADDLDALNEQISERIVESGEAHILTTKVKGTVSLRACFLHYENDEADVEHLLGLVCDLGARLAREAVTAR